MVAGVRVGFVEKLVKEDGPSRISSMTNQEKKEHEKQPEGWGAWGLFK